MLPDFDTISTNTSSNKPFALVLNRRQFLGGVTALLASSALTPAARALAHTASPSTLTFPEVPHGYDETVTVPDTYRLDIVARWGDAVLKNAPAFDWRQPAPESQAAQFGFNNDYIAFLPLPLGSNNSDHGLLSVNHEYTNGYTMFEGVSADDMATTMTHTHARVEMAAHGLSVIEVIRQDGRWRTIAGDFNRRFDALTTPYIVSGAAKGSPRLATPADPNAERVIGMIGNCAGGVTPWGTVLTCEENFSDYFTGTLPEAERVAYERYGVGGSRQRYPWWGKADARFNLDAEPNGANRYGWVVEIDPYEPDSLPVKRTSLGRFKHEGANTVVNKDGRVVVYMGDDQVMEYIYKFVTAKPYDPNNRNANKDLLDDGTLYVARFNDDNTVTWLPLVHGQNGLTPEKGFSSQADVVINARGAADILGATPMDRPEDIEVNPVNNKVYAILTGHTERPADKIDAANPRPANRHGHILELSVTENDHAALTSRWDIFLLAGDPGKPEDKAIYHPNTSADGWISMPDNCTFDNRGRLWITTDGMPRNAQLGDGLFGCDVDGTGRALTRRLVRTPFGAEATGVCFTPDNTTVFLSIQHPGEDSKNLANPTTRWPDFTPGLPPRPSVIAIQHKDGRIIGT